MPPKPTPTHFLCIPLSGTRLVRSMSAFKAEVTSGMTLGSGGGAVIPERAVRPPGTMHLTLGVMSLRDEAVTRAVEFLKDIRLREVLEQAKVAAASSVTPAARAMGVDDTGAAAAAAASSSSSSTRNEDTDGLYITLRGLNAMQSPSKTTVLYASPVDSGQLLRRFCELLRAKFAAAELMTPEDRPLLLHATVVNTIYVKGNRSRGAARGGRGGRERLTIDARDLVDRYEDYVWLENMKVEKVRICRMGAKKVEDGEVEGDEAYEVEGEVTF